MELNEFSVKSLEDRTEEKREGYSYKLLGGTGYGLDINVENDLGIDESKMAALVPFADGNNRDGVGDLIEVSGIDLSRHRRNPIVLMDHAKDYKLPIALVEDPDTKEYTCYIDPVAKTAKDLCYFYRGTGIKGVERSTEKDHAQFCEQLFDLWTKRYVRGGSIGYLVKSAREIPPNYETSTPKGAHLLSVMKLETSIVVLPCNADTVKMVLAMPKVCGKSLSPYLVKSLTPFAPVETKVSVGFDQKALPPNVSTEEVSHDERNPGVDNPAPHQTQTYLNSGQPIAPSIHGVKELRKKYRSPEQETKAMPEEVTREVKEDVPAVIEANPEAQEPYSAQVARHLHVNDLENMEHYDSMLPMLEHAEYKKHLIKRCQGLEKHLAEQEMLWDKHHKPNGLKDLEGRIPNDEEEHPEEQIEEESKEEAAPEEEEAESSEEEPEEEEAEPEEKSLSGMKTKSLRLKYRKKNLCPHCGQDPCACDEPDEEDVPGYEETQEHDGEVEDPGEDTDVGYEEEQSGPGEDEESVAEDTDLGFEEAQDKPGGNTNSMVNAFQPHHKKALMEIKGFFDELASAGEGTPLGDPPVQQWSFHFGKSLEGIMKDMGMDEMGEKDDEGMGEEKSLGAKHPFHMALQEAADLLGALRGNGTLGRDHTLSAAMHEKCESCSKSLQDIEDGESPEAGDEEETEGEHEEDQYEDTPEDEGESEGEEEIEDEDREEEIPEEEVIGFDEDGKSLKNKPKKLKVKTKSNPDKKTKTLKSQPKEKPTVKAKTNPKKPVPVKPNNRLKKAFEYQKQVLDTESSRIEKLNKQLERLSKFVQ